MKLVPYARAPAITFKSGRPWLLKRWSTASPPGTLSALVPLSRDYSHRSCSHSCFIFWVTSPPSSPALGRMTCASHVHTCFASAHGFLNFFLRKVFFLSLTRRASSPVGGGVSRDHPDPVIAVPLHETFHALAHAVRPLAHTVRSLAHAVRTTDVHYS